MKFRRDQKIAGSVPAGLKFSGLVLPILAGCTALPSSALAERPLEVSIRSDAEGVTSSPLLCGAFFEDINRGGDGGLYAEMIQNRSFEDDETIPLAWSLVSDGGAEGAMALDRALALNPKNRTSLRLDVKNAVANGRVGIANYGFRGCVKPAHADRARWLADWEKAVANATRALQISRGKDYVFSCYVRSEGIGAITVSLEGEKGEVLASEPVELSGNSWAKHERVLRSNKNDSNARLVVLTKGSGTVWLDMVSLIPNDTFKGRGLRSDLAEMIAELRPGFLRFPGGCVVEGDTLEDAMRWKETIGDVAERPGRWNRWGYRSTDGLGYFECLQFCEDLGAEPLFVINCGMSHQEDSASKRREPVSVDMREYIQDALDAIEFANGPVTSRWGAARARAGHPKPFGLRYIEIGNENGGPVYEKHYALMHDAIKKRYPEITLIACDWGGTPKTRSLDMVDMHDFNSPRGLFIASSRFDDYDRKGPNVYFGEYAANREPGHGNLRAALGEAAFLAGLERNSDVVLMSSFAPLLEQVGWSAWSHNAIRFDNERVFGTPSYWVQHVFSRNRVDTVLPADYERRSTEVKPLQGQVALGTWETEAEFKDIKVTAADGKVLFDSGKSEGKWNFVRGSWVNKDGVLRQTGLQDESQAEIGDESWVDYTVSLKARKIKGSEGFLVSFGLCPGEKRRWAIGGWGNVAHGLDMDDVEKASAKVEGTIECGKWYDIRVELQGDRVRCFLDGKLLHDVRRHRVPDFVAVAGRKADELVIKLVNGSGQARSAQIDIGPVRPSSPAKAIVLTSGNPRDENSFEEPQKVVPQETSIEVSGPRFEHTLPANSLTVLRLRIEAWAER